MHNRQNEGDLRRQWHQTFKEAYCSRLHCSPERFETHAFWTCIFRHALPLAWLIYRRDPGFFTEDLDLIREVGKMTDPELFKSEVNYFHGRNLRDKRWVRTILRVRVSGGRLMRLRRRLGLP